MSASVIGALRVNLGLDSALFEKGAKRAQQPLAALRKQILTVVSAASALGGAIGTFALKSAQDIDKVAKSARRIDASVAGYRALEMAADDAGANISSLADDIQTMNREIAKNSKGAQEALKVLGITAAELGSLDADQKIALIADRVKALGLDSGQASVLLQKLGVRNREMALLVLGGGAALRQARIDVEEYGLALSDIDAAKIEAANDEIAGLADIGAYLGDQLALKIVPGLGNMAKAMTESLRAGGLLRGVLDGLVGLVERLGAYLTVVIAGFGIRYVAAVGLAAAATAGLSGALIFLRTALVRTGIGILVVAAGELVYWLGRAIGAASSFGDGLRRVFEIGKAVFLGVGNTAWGLSEILAGVASSIAASFVRAFALIGERWDSLVNGMASAWNAIAETSFGETLGLGVLGMSDVGGKIGALADGLMDQAVGSITRGGERIKAAGQSVAEAMKSSASSISDTANQSNEAEDAAQRLAGALDELANSAGGAKDKTKELTDAQKALEQASDQVEGNFESAFASFVTGAKSAKQAVAELLANLAQMAASAAFKGLFGGSKGFDILGAIFGGGKSFAGGGYTGSAPRTGGLDGQGGFMAMLHPRETVVDHTRLGGNLAGTPGGGAGQMIVRAYSDPGVILEISQNVTREGLKQFSGEPLTQALRAQQTDLRMVRT